MIWKFLFCSATVCFLSTMEARGQEVGSPSAFALQINGAVATLAQRAEFAERQAKLMADRVQELEKKLADMKSPETKKDPEDGKK